MPSAGMTADRKRASRFTLAERGRLRELSAHLDGNGGATKTWYSFTVNNVLLQPGDYWIGIFTGGTEQVLRNYGDGAANWYGNNDVYADGATDPFGTGTTGTVTLSVRAGYTLE